MSAQNVAFELVPVQDRSLINEHCLSLWGVQGVPDRESTFDLGGSIPRMDRNTGPHLTLNSCYQPHPGNRCCWQVKLSKQLVGTAKISLSPLKGHDGNTAEWHAETDKLIGAKLAVANL